MFGDIVTALKAGRCGVGGTQIKGDIMKKITIVSVVLVLILGMVFTFTACNYESINSIEFSDLSDVELGFSLIFKDGKSYE